jgi:hypothetical protein
MGNGYTFPLETLIFWGLAAACCDRDSDATVYGDDIIIPSDRFELLAEILRYAGFILNVGKSFHVGPFRESCGKDYFKGIDVRPFYAKGWVSAQLLFVLHNFYVRDGDPERAKMVEDFIHPSLRIYGPDLYGDGHLLGDHPKYVPEKHRDRGYGGYFFDSFTTKQKKSFKLLPGDAILPHYSIYRRSSDTDEWVVSAIPTRKGNGHTLVIDFNDKMVEAVFRNEDISRPVQCAPLPLPVKDGNKVLTLPGVAGYKKVTIYTLGS